MCCELTHNDPLGREFQDFDPATLKERRYISKSGWGVEGNLQGAGVPMYLLPLVLLGGSGRVFGRCCLRVFVSAACSGEDDKIVGGYECVPHSVPYQVYIRRFRKPWCGASLLNSQWILSASHCYLRPKLLNVWVGAHDLSSEESSRQFSRVIRAIRHPGYNHGTTDNDIMLLKISPPVKLNDKVRPVRLPSSCAGNGSYCLVSGWGNTVRDGEQYPHRLQCLNVPILSDPECEATYGDTVTPNMFCAGFLEGGKEACQVDSGGPLVCDGVQQGIVSWGLDCGQPGWTTIYTKLCNYISWINETIASN